MAVFPGQSGGTALPEYRPAGFTVSVRDKSYGAYGDGIHDDTAAIQFALDDALAHVINGWASIRFPFGKYKISGELIVKCPLIMTFEKSIVTGVFGDGTNYLIRIDDGASQSGPYIFEGGLLGTGGSNDPHMGGIALHGNEASPPSQPVGITLRDMVIESNGMGIWGQCYDFRAYACKFVGLGGSGHGADLPTSAYQRGIAVATGGEGVISGCEFQSNGIGASLFGYGWSVAGGRAEQNYSAFRIGEAPPGLTVTAGTGDIDISGVQMEANAFSYQIYGGQDIRISSLGCQASYIAPPNVGGGAQIGLQIRAGDEITVENAGMGGDCQIAAVQVLGGNKIRFVNCNASCTQQGPYSLVNQKSWDIQCDPREVYFENCNYDPLNPTQTNTATTTKAGFQMRSNVAARAIPRADLLRGTVYRNNLSGNVAVGSAATSVSVVFPASLADGSALLLNANSTSGGTLAAGTYYFAASLVNESGECERGNEVSCVIDGSATTAALVTRNSSPGITANDRWLLYVGLATGTYIGCIDMPIGVNMAPFTLTDLSQITRYKSPANVPLSAPGCAEPDANYGVHVTPGWNAGAVWVTSKATTGFTVNWQTAPGSNTALDWLIA